MEHVASIEVAGRSTPIALVRMPSSPGRPAWRITSTTLTALEPLLDEIPWVEEHLPSFLTRTRFAEITPWQWIALPGLVLLATALGALLTRMLRGPVRRLATWIWSDAGELVDVTRAPLRLLASVGFFLGLLPSLLLSVPAQAVVRKLGLAVLAVGLIWLGARGLDEFGRRTIVRLTDEGRLDAAGLVRPASRVAKLALALVVLVVLAQNFGLDVTGVIAGLGVGGLAVALAAQKTVENLFGGVTLVADRPVQVGDFCRFGDRLGTIEEIGLRSTRVRTLDRTLVTVPNAEFSALQLENYAARDRIWLKLVLGLRYETTADQLRGVLAALRQMLLDHPRVDDDPARVRFLDYGAYSLDVELFAYVLTNRFDEYLEVREQILLSIMDIVAEHGTGFAFPSQTIYTTRDGGIDPGRAAATAPGVRIDARGA
jgi:MscS family membrane protein